VCALNDFGSTKSLGKNRMVSVPGCAFAARSSTTYCRRFSDS
jgi:hypothetical protein